jgi:hypothetical protein
VDYCFITFLCCIKMIVIISDHRYFSVKIENIYCIFSTCLNITHLAKGLIGSVGTLLNLFAECLSFVSCSRHSLMVICGSSHHLDFMYIMTISHSNYFKRPC